jgi:hypothetical protein
VLSDRIGRDGAPAPISLVVHDSANTTTLCRLFTVGSQRMTLTAVATGSHLTPLAIDPALAKIHKMLLKREPAAALPVAGAKEPVL